MNTRLEPYQKITLCLLAVMAVIFAIWTGVNRSHKGAMFYESFLEVSREDGAAVYRGTLYGTSATITCREESSAKTVDVDIPGYYSAACRVEYPEGTIQTEFGHTAARIRIIRDGEVLFSGGVDSESRYFNEDGTWEAFLSIRAIGADPWSTFEFAAHDILFFAKGPELTARGSWAIYFAMLFGSIIMALETIFRDEIFYLRHFRVVRDPEPTEYFYTSHKIGNVIGLILALAFYITGVFTIA